MITRLDAIQILLGYVDDDDFVLSTTGMLSREVFHIRDRDRNFYMLGSMGLISSFGLGLALMNPKRRFIVLDGDGSALMSLGTMPLVARECPPNLLHIILDNEAYESTGSQPSISSSTSIANIGRAAGYRSSEQMSGQDTFQTALNKFNGTNGPALIVVKVSIATLPNIPRISHRPNFIRDRFKSHFDGV